MKKKKKKILSHETEKFTSKNLKLLKGRFPSVWEQVQAPKRGNRSLQKKHPPCVEDKRIEDHIQKTKFLLYGDSDPVVSVKKIIETGISIRSIWHLSSASDWAIYLSKQSKKVSVTPAL
jgi:hypothetical protein